MSDAAPAPAGSGAERLQLAAAHRIATGAGQVVAVIDTGVAAHPRLANRLRGGGDYLTGGSGLADCDGHGTAVAGIIAASDAGRDDGGVEGIAPAAAGARHPPVEPVVRGRDGPTAALRPAGDIRTLAEAIVLAVRSGATVINISEAVCLRAQQAATQGASVQAALRLAARSDVVVVAAAGNAGVGSCAAAGQEPADQVALPGWYDDDILTVGAVGPDDAPGRVHRARRRGWTWPRRAAVCGPSPSTAERPAPTSRAPASPRPGWPVWPRCCASASRS